MSFRSLIREDQSGGYDCQFITTVPDRFSCNICTKVLRDPELAVCCGQHYCGSCLKQWFSKQRKESCPHCRAEGANFQHVANRGLKAEISQLKIHCPNRGSGCSWTGELGNLKQHLELSSGCAYAQVDCTNHCGTKPCRKDLTTHVRNQCPLRLDTCQHCKKQDTFSAIEKHKSACPKFPVYCPNRCSYSPITRDSLPAHLNSCKLARQPCPFEEAGCTIRAKRDDITKHVASNQSQHLLMLMETNKKMLEELRETKKELQEITQELVATNNKMKQEAESLKTMKRALAFEVGAIEDSSTENEKAGAFRSLKSHLEEEELDRLDSLIFRVLDFAKHVRESTSWYSPPFIIEGYRVCLAVYPKGLGSGAGTHASLSLVLLGIRATSPEKEEFMSALEQIRIMIPLFKQDPSKIHRVFLKDVKSGDSLDLSPLKSGEMRRVLGTMNEWISHGIVARELEKQSLIMKIERAGSFGSLHAALLTSAMRATRDDCRTS